MCRRKHHAAGARTDDQHRVDCGQCPRHRAGHGTEHHGDPHGQRELHRGRHRHAHQLPHFVHLSRGCAAHDPHRAHGQWRRKRADLPVRAGGAGVASAARSRLVPCAVEPRLGTGRPQLIRTHGHAAGGYLVRGAGDQPQRLWRYGGQCVRGRDAGQCARHGPHRRSPHRVRDPDHPIGGPHPGGDRAGPLQCERTRTHVGQHPGRHPQRCVRKHHRQGAVLQWQRSAQCTDHCPEHARWRTCGLCAEDRGWPGALCRCRSRRARGAGILHQLRGELDGDGHLPGG